MIDINRIRDNPKEIAASLKKRNYILDFDKILKLDADKKYLMAKSDDLRNERNITSSQVPKLKKEGKPLDELFELMRKKGEEIAEYESKIEEVSKQLNDLLIDIPNIPDYDLIGGGKENNAVISTFGSKPKFDFEPKHHVELCETLGLIDYERGARLAGTGHWIYTGDGARLEWALLNFFIDEHIKNGFQFMLLPYMLNYNCGYGAGQFPKFESDVFWIDNKQNKQKFLLPTAETALVNLHAGEILNEAELPKRYAGYTACFRREAGSYRQEERGMIRGHQFNKVEMVEFTTNEKSDMAFDELLGFAQSLVQKLGLHYQLVKLASGDCSDSMCRTYDIEVWIPSMQIYKEVSSVSNARDYQSRRTMTRYRDSKTGKTEFAHTLNASGLATSRIFPAIVEQFQNADGSVSIPEVLQKYMGGQTQIKPKL